ncbi:acyl-CoA dehydrogenase family protein [Paenibacillus filicis]|uniref:Acyl-CoA dehydrogenase family protein n=1 Tax=Paenibacillus filicis TaxID=669464 RepID=A0ABU9DCZ6_9BACL
MSVTTERKEAAYYIDLAARLAEQFAKDAVERDKAGGTPTAQLNLLRESGLLSAFIPVQYGGGGQPWSVILRIVRELSRADASIGHLYGYHCLPLTRLYMVGSEEQKRYYFTESVRNQWFWGNSGNVMDRRLLGKRDGNRYIVNGVKGFSSGSPGSDYLSVLWWDEETLEPIGGFIPTNRKGVVVCEDWDGMGQRQTGSGTVRYEHVIVDEHEILHSTNEKETGFTYIIALLSFNILTNVFIGSARGAITEAAKYTLAHSRPWIASGVEKAADDPSIHRQYGELWIQVEGAEALADLALDKFDRIWEKQEATTPEERGEASILFQSANVLAGNVALEVTSRMFEVMGARSATAAQGFDRFWRNVRTHTLHNPAEYKLRQVGKWVLTGEYPTPGYYS